MLNGLSIMIVDDDKILGRDLASAVERIDGRPIGPVTTVAEAFAILETQIIAAAILDANLPDGEVTPLALALIERRMPFVVHTGVGLPADLARSHPDLPVVFKPARPTAVLAALLQQVSPDRTKFHR